jgi:REP element-mobilizing transposase RayT
MTRPRSQLVSLETTPYYHCICRCVRRAFLMGKDTKGRSFDHRKTWLVQRIKFLGEIFAIDIAAYAVMSNHYHLVLHVDMRRANGWDDDEVCRRWAKLYRGPELLRRYLSGEPLKADEREELNHLVHTWRAHLCNLSRFMACLNYVIALRANKEDGCTGRFWEGRFKSQALRDETALLACMVYVDLNPVRAGIAADLESSDFTSIQDRIRRAQKKPREQHAPRLMRFGEAEKQSQQHAETICNWWIGMAVPDA